MELLYTIFLLPIETIMKLVLELAYKFTNNYGVVIILLSIIINIALIPIYNMAEKWREKDKAIRNSMKFALDKIKQNYKGKERYFYTQALYKIHNYSPISSVKASAGFLIQIPFFFAAFSLLSNYEPIAGVGFGILSDLSKPDGLLFGLNLLPFVMTAINLLATYVYINKFDKNEKYQLWGIALLFLVLLYTQASALLLYWTFNNIFSLIKNLIEKNVKIEKPKFIESFSLQKISEIAEKIYPKKVWINYVIAGLYIVGLGFLYLSLDGFNIANIMYISYEESYLKIFVISLFIANSIQYLNALKYKKLDKLFFIISGILLISYIGILIPFYKIKMGIVILLFINSIILLLANSNFMDKFIIKKELINTKLFALIYSSIFLIIFLVNPILLFQANDQLTIEFSNLFLNSYILFLIQFTLFFALFKISGDKTKYLLNLFGILFLIVILFYAFIIKYDFGVLDQFVFQDANKLNLPSYILLIEFLFIIAIASILFYKAYKYVRVIEKVTAVLLVLFFVFIIFNYQNSEEVIVSSIEEHKDNGNFLNIEEQSILSFSKEKNILVLFLDGFPGGHIQKILNENPNVFNNYKGFTWYKNTLSTSTATMASHSAMVGGHQFTLKFLKDIDYNSIKDIDEKAYQIFPNAFKKNNWQLDYYNPPSNNLDNLEKIVNISTYDYGKDYLLNYEKLTENDLIKIENSKKFFEFININFVSIFNIVPLSLKKYIYLDGDWLLLKRSLLDKFSFNSIVVKSKDWGFLNILENKMNIENSNKTLKYFSMVIPHTPNAIDLSGKLNPKETSFYIEGYKAIEKIGDILEKLRLLGIYEQTKIILVSDHGWNIEDAILGYKEDLENKIIFRDDMSKDKGKGWGYPILLVKDFNEKGEFKISDTFVSNADLASIVCSASETGCDIPDLDPLKNDLKRDLYITSFSYKGFNINKKFIIGDIYKVKENIFDPKNWEKVKDSEKE